MVVIKIKKFGLHPLSASGSSNVENRHDIDDESPFFVSKATDESDEY